MPSAAAAAAAFAPGLARAPSQTFFRGESSEFGAGAGTGNVGAFPLRDSLNLSEQYAATVRGGGPKMFDEYAIEGEDLDWTKVTDPRERKRLQNIINGRKYRERRLAAEADANPGGSPGASAGGSVSGFGGMGSIVGSQQHPAFSRDGSLGLGGTGIGGL